MQSNVCFFQMESVNLPYLRYLGVKVIPQDHDNEGGIEGNVENDSNSNIQGDHQDLMPPDTDINETESNDCKCVICDKSFKRKNNLKRHMKVHNNQMETCDYCCKEFYTSYDLRIHRESAHQNVKRKCSLCAKTFSSKLGLTNHLRQHSNDCRYICPFCGKGFNYKTDFQGHTYGHEGIKPFKCVRKHFSMKKTYQSYNIKTSAK